MNVASFHRQPFAVDHDFTAAAQHNHHLVGRRVKVRRDIRSLAGVANHHDSPRRREDRLAGDFSFLRFGRRRIPFVIIDYDCLCRRSIRQALGNIGREPLFEEVGIAARRNQRRENGNELQIVGFPHPSSMDVATGIDMNVASFHRQPFAVDHDFAAAAQHYHHFVGRRVKVRRYIGSLAGVANHHHGARRREDRLAGNLGDFRRSIVCIPYIIIDQHRFAGLGIGQPNRHERLRGTSECCE